MLTSARAVTLRASAEGLPVTELPVGKTSFRAARRLRRALVEHRIDVLMVDKRRDVVHGAAAVLGLPVALVARFLFPQWIAPTDPLFRLAYARVDLTNFLTSGAADHVAKTAPFILRRPHNVIHEGVDVDRFKRNLGAGTALRARLGLGDGPLVVGVGALEVEKRYTTLIAAVGVLPPPRPAVVLVGVGSEREGLARQAATLGLDLRLPGALPGEDLPALYSAAAVFAHPSTMEAFGLAVAEAMACACPVVVADAGSLPEVVGDAGVVVPAEDPGALGRKLGLLLADEPKRLELGRLARARVAGRYTLEQMQRAHVEALRNARASRLTRTP